MKHFSQKMEISVYKRKVTQLKKKISSTDQLYFNITFGRDEEGGAVVLGYCENISKLAQCLHPTGRILSWEQFGKQLTS